MRLRAPEWALAAVAAWLVSGCVAEDRTDLDVTPPRTTLRAGETVQLTVIQRLPDGSARDLTSPDSGTTYFTTGESRLVAEPDGRVTCIGTNGQEKESAVIGVGNGQHHGHIRFKLLPSDSTPGLRVTAERTLLREDEGTQLRVFPTRPRDGRREVDTTTGRSSSSSGTVT